LPYAAKLVNADARAATSGIRSDATDGSRSLLPPAPRMPSLHPGRVGGPSRPSNGPTSLACERWLGPGGRGRTVPSRLFGRPPPPSPSECSVHSGDLADQAARAPRRVRSSMVYVRYLLAVAFLCYLVALPLALLWTVTFRPMVRERMSRIHQALTRIDGE
jgi:hypothetical protein